MALEPRPGMARRNGDKWTQRGYDVAVHEVSDSDSTNASSTIYEAEVEGSTLGYFPNEDEARKAISIEVSGRPRKKS